MAVNAGYPHPRRDPFAIHDFKDANRQILFAIENFLVLYWQDSRRQYESLGYARHRQPNDPKMNWEKFLDPAVLCMMIPIVAILIHGIGAIYHRFCNHQERIAMIENGIHPDDESQRRRAKSAV
ncbi:hypothetical protein CA13_55770 [Planctomycetes bacterium CA13]|uniref:Uncharacterized protein n=1 Tax=Novipirellula herctigrandis TaxID=2527986 RepID=A0A5C5ZB60_9BACT|nr:hypothetical protein CA13_55770 [Planctomycetes bacterium CA13]